MRVQDAFFLVERRQNQQKKNKKQKKTLYSSSISKSDSNAPFSPSSPAQTKMELTIKVI